MSAVDKKLAAFTEACRAAGLKVTHQRTEIMRELAGREDHPDADLIYQAVRRRIPAISLDTVYRTLRTMEDHGVISRVGVPGDRTRFDGNSRHHHHFVCTECGLIRDFYSDDLDHVTPPPTVLALGDVERVCVEIRGRCQACLNKHGDVIEGRKTN